MKWTNKGHEFDEYASDIKKIYGKKVVVFGAGNFGEKLGKALDYFNLLECFIDNDIKRQKDKLLGRDIISLDEYMKMGNSNLIIVVAVSAKFSNSIVNQLENARLKINEDFWTYNEFHDKVMPILLSYYYDKIYMELAQITLTERCSLKCKKCAHGCYNVDNKADDMPLSFAFKSADSFFSKVDFIDEFVLIGGEPLLYSHLAEVVEYVGIKYRNQMGIYSITTNGTIIPNEKVLKSCKEHKVLFRISNYSKTLPRLADSYKRLIETLENYGIEYNIGDGEGSWIDYGFDYVEKEYNPDELMKSFDLCHTPCREVRGNKLYYCVMARSVSDNLKFNEGVNDFLDLDSLKSDNYKKELMDFNMGYSDKGYLDMCRRCNGMDVLNYPIPVAEQI
jgi:hypothetical protein